MPTCDVVGNYTIRPSQVEFAEPKSPSKSTTKSSSITLGGQQNKGKGAGCTAIGLTGSPTGLTASSRVSGGKFQPKMVKPKKPEIGVWKTDEAKGRKKNQKEKPKPILFIESFRLNPKGKLMSMMLVGLKISSNKNLLQNRNSMNRIGNGAILTYQCRFHHMDHLYMCHGDFF